MLARVPSAFAIMPAQQRTGSIFTDIHFLIPVAVLCIGLALLVTLH